MYKSSFKGRLLSDKKEKLKPTDTGNVNKPQNHCTGRSQTQKALYYTIPFTLSSRKRKISDVKQINGCQELGVWISEGHERHLGMIYVSCIMTVVMVT